MKIKKWTFKDFSNKNLLLMGNNRSKRNMIERIILAGKNNKEMPALIVFDKDGSLYEKFGRGEILADWNSEGGCFPDYLAPILNNEKFGSSIDSIVQALLGVFDHSKRTMTNNEQFWSYAATKTLAQYCEYLLWMLKEAQNNDVPKKEKNLLCELGAYSKDLKEVMCELVNSTPATRAGIFSKRLALRPLVDYISLKNGEKALPFDGTLNGVGNVSNTQVSVLQSAEAQGTFLFKFMSEMHESKDFLSAVPGFDLEEYIANPAGKMLFICGSGNDELDAGLSAIASLSIVAASISKKSHAVMVLPDSEKWNMTATIEKLKYEADSHTSFISYFSNEARACDEFDLPQQEEIAKLVTEHDSTIWFSDKNKSVQELFLTATTEIDRIYGISDLNEQIFAVSDKQGSVSYYFQDGMSVRESPYCQAARVRRNRKVCGSLWFHSLEQQLSEFEILRLVDLGYLNKNYDEAELKIAAARFCADYEDIDSSDLLSENPVKQFIKSAPKDTEDIKTKSILGIPPEELQRKLLEVLHPMKQMKQNSKTKARKDK